jgi:hypothetical protein
MFSFESIFDILLEVVGNCASDAVVEFGEFS